MIKPYAEWSFTDQPDVFRMCRELRDAGCWLGTASRADGVLTLVDFDRATAFAKVRAGEVRAACDHFHVFGGWYALRGDHVRAILSVSPITVRGYR